MFNLEALQLVVVLRITGFAEEVTRNNIYIFVVVVEIDTVECGTFPLCDFVISFP